jgi:predicted TIM-barrel fold metal-dependent hydrolase
MTATAPSETAQLALAGARPSIFGAPAIDCDVHIAVPSIKAIMPYLDEYWRAQFLNRGIDRLSWNMTSEPPNAPINARPDWRPPSGKPGTDLGTLRDKALDAFGTSIAIANCIWGGQVLHSEDMAAAVCTAVNDWIAAEWLDREPRLRASIVVPLSSPEYAVEEIERRAGDPRFVQVLMLAALEQPLGKRVHWPIYRAAEAHDLPIGIHAGSTYHHPPIAGWPSHFVEDYVANAFAFENAVLSLVSEGVFAKFPRLKVVMMESGVSWLPAALWRFNKTWRGTRIEIPWVKRAPAEIIRQHVRLTIQPFDEPEGGGRLERVVEQLGGEGMLLFSTDFPHWHFDGTDALPLPPMSPFAARILCENAIETYPRLRLSLTPL